MAKPNTENKHRTHTLHSKVRYFHITPIFNTDSLEIANYHPTK